MSKRFTDTGKWDKAWFRKLSPKMKCVWMFLCDRCDHAGIWEFDQEAFFYFIGESVCPDEILHTFSGRIEMLDADKLSIKTFNEFQYGKLNPDNRVHKSVIQRLEKLAPNKVLLSPFKGAKDKDKDKDKDKEKGECEGKTKLNLESLYKKYPRKQGKAPGIKTAKAQVKTPEDFDRLSTAIDRFIAHHRQAKTSPEFIPYFSTFMSQWTDWLDSDTGKSENFTVSSIQSLREELDFLPEDDREAS